MSGVGTTRERQRQGELDAYLRTLSAEHRREFERMHAEEYRAASDKVMGGLSDIRHTFEKERALFMRHERD